MWRVSKIVMAVAVVALISTGVAVAQTSTQTLTGEVLHVYGDNLVVKMADGSVREFDVQPGFMFDVDGTPTAVGDLKPGTMLTAEVTTTSMPRTVVHETVRSGELLRRVGQTLVVRMDDGTVRRFSNVSSDVTFTVNGREVSVFDLRPGMLLTAHIVSEGTEVVTDRQVVASGAAPEAPAAPAEPAPVAAPAPAPAPAPAVLPSTASLLPLVGLAGLALLVLGLGVGIIRRF